MYIFNWENILEKNSKISKIVWYNFSKFYNIINFNFSIYTLYIKLLLKVLYNLQVTDPVTPSIIKINSILILS